MRAHKVKKTKLLVGIGIPLLIVAIILYMLADRYLIEHVELVVSDTASGSGETSSESSEDSSLTESATPQETASDETGNWNLTAGSSTNSWGASSSPKTSSSVSQSSSITNDDWNYQSDSVQIAIKKVTTGSGSNTITYFVADIQLSSASLLRSAFAENKFGRNITENTSQIASDHNAIFAINGDYYGFRDDGVIIRNGVLYRDSATRDGVAFYQNGLMKTYDETQISSSALLKNGVLNTLSFGPILIQNGVQVTDFDNTKIDNNFGNRSIQAANPRTGIGMISANHFVFVVVDGRKTNYSRGMTLLEFASLFSELGCKEAYNLDGGGSSTMYFMGRVVNNPLGKGQERGVSDILYI